MNMISDRPYEALNYFKVNSNVIDEVKAMAAQQMSAGEKAISINGSEHLNQVQQVSLEDKVVQSSEKVADFERPETQTITAYDYAKNYKPNQVFNMKGADSDLESLDEVPSYEMQDKDQVLSQYRIFGASTNQDQDMILQQEITALALENFEI